MIASTSTGIGLWLARHQKKYVCDWLDINRNRFVIGSISTGIGL